MSWLLGTIEKNAAQDSVKKQAAFIASSIYIVFYIVVGLIEEIPLYGISFALLMFFTLFITHKDRVDIAFTAIVIVSETAAAYILLFRGETTGIPLLLLAYIIVAVCFHSILNVVILLINITILTLYMIGTKQLGTNIMYLRIVTQIIFCVITYLCSFSIQKLLVLVERAEDSKRQLQIYQMQNQQLRIQNQQLAAYQAELIHSSRAIVSALSHFEKGATKSRVQAEGNLFPEIAYLINNILQRQTDLLRTKEELEKVSNAAKRTASLIQFAKAEAKPVHLSLTGTEMDNIISELDKKFITDNLSAK